MVSYRIGGGGGTHLFDYAHFCWNHTHLIKIVSGLELVTSIGRLMRIAIEGPQLTEVNFHQLLDIYKQQTHRILL